MRRALTFPAAIILAAALAPRSAGTEPPLDWLTTKQAAMATAIDQDRLVLLVAGRPSCSLCNSVVHGTCETEAPPIKQLILAEYVPWFCHIDQSSDWRSYASGMGSFYLPLICLIDPQAPDSYLARTNGPQVSETFYGWLQAVLPPPVPRFVSIAAEGGGVRLEWEAEPGTPYLVEWAPAPDGPWNALASPQVAAQDRLTLSDPLSDPRRFYRVIKDP